jgi:hypothetical protein
LAVGVEIFTRSAASGPFAGLHIDFLSAAVGGLDRTTTEVILREPEKAEECKAIGFRALCNVLP